MTEGEAQTAFHYLKSRGWIEANFKIFYAARMSPAGHDAIKEAEQSQSAVDAMGLTRNPALDAMGVKSDLWSTSLGEALRGDGSGTLKYALRSSPDTTGDDASVPDVKIKPEPTSPKPPGEIFTLKPTVYGVGVDLKEMARRFRAWRARRQGTSS
jgi:hypothetical protein